MLSKVTGYRVHLERNLTFLIDKINADLKNSRVRTTGHASFIGENKLEKTDMYDESIEQEVSLFDFDEDFQPEDIVEISFADFFQREGNSQYKNLWFFTRC